jgi:MoxR-like ATPase
MATTGRPRRELRKVLDGEQLLAIQRQVRDLPVSEHVVKYATHLVRMTRPADAEAPEIIRKYVHCGAGPRAAQCLILGAKARAVLQGRVNVACEDIRALALPVLRHRIFTNFTADSEGLTADRIIRELLPLCREYR